MRHRQRAQTFAIGAFAMISLLGALSMVIDAGIYFVIQRELQTAADAAALAAVWYDPACDKTSWGPYGCQANNPNSPAFECTQAPNNAVSGNDHPCTAAVDIVEANWAAALSLCAGPNLRTGQIHVNIVALPGIPPKGSLVIPKVTPYVVTLSCDAPHWFARVLPNVKLTMRISKSATAALGWLGDNGQLVDDTVPPTKSQGRLVARLLT